MTRTIKEFERGDGAHCGLTDWYPEKKAALKAAIEAEGPFDTGWYASKKEIASARILRDHEGTYFVHVSVSDDFDTPGNGEGWFKMEGDSDAILDRIRDEIWQTWQAAEDDQKSNRSYQGFAVRDVSGKYPRWVETYIEDISGWGWDSPPGDCYYEWGWQGDKRKPLPQRIRKRFEDWILSESREYPDRLRIGRFVIEPWKD